MSERVRAARALDAIEKVVDWCCENAVAGIRRATNVQNEFAYDIAGAVDDAAGLYGVDREMLEREAWKMLRNGLDRALRPVCEVRYVKPHVMDGRTVGMAARVYKFPLH